MSLLLALTGGGGGPTAYADSLSVGTYSISGKTVTDLIARGDALAKGAYTIAGKAITDTVARPDALSAGAYSISGKDITDVVTTGGGTVAYADALSAGAYVIAGMSLVDVLAQPPTKHGGDDAFHHTGWNKEDWKRKQLREDAIEGTIEATYQRLMGIAPAPSIVAEIKREARAEIQRIDYTQERKFIEWLSSEIASIKAIQQDLDNDDEEAIMLLLG